MYFRLILFALIALFASCNQTESNQNTATEDSTQPDANAANSPVIDSAVISAITKNHLDEPGSTYMKITAETDLAVLKFTKQTDTNANFYPNYAQACEKWTLTAEQIVQVLRTSKELWGEEWLHLYEVLPCSVTGTVNINGKLARFEVNAGASTALFFKDSTVRLGYAKPDFKKYFLEGQQTP